MNLKYYRTWLNLTPFLFFSLGIISCSVTKPKNEAKSEIPPKIIFLNYSINRKYEIRLIDKFITEGKIKASLPLNTGDLKCVILNHSRPIDSLIIADPLNITVESVNENGQLFKKDIALDSAQFFIRVQLNPKADAIAIKKSNSYLIITRL
jgi:hypothetical protein